MRGSVLVEKESNKKWLYVPEAHIQFYVAKSGNGNWVVCAFRTDCLIETSQGSMPVTEHLKMAYQTVAELDVPDHIVKFAVKEEGLRHTSVSEIAKTIESAVLAGNPDAGFERLIGLFEEQDLELDPNEENAVGEEINEIMAQAGGLQ